MRVLGLLIVAVAFVSVVATARAEDRLARVGLIIGNGSYAAADTALSAATADARLLATDLRREKFDIDIKENVGGTDMRRAIDSFLGKIHDGTVALLYFSGYGIQVGGQTFLIPVNAQISTEANVRDVGINLNTTLSEMHRRGAKVKIVIIDAARQNPYETRFRKEAAGLAAIAAPEGMLAIYSAALGKLVLTAPGSPSLFMEQLIKALGVTGRSTEDAFNSTRDALARATNYQQVPWVATSLFDQFYLADEPAAGKSPAKTSAAATTTTTTTTTAPAQTTTPAHTTTPATTTTPPAKTVTATAPTTTTTTAPAKTTPAVTQTAKPATTSTPAATTPATTTTPSTTTKTATTTPATTTTPSTTTTTPVTKAAPSTTTPAKPLQSANRVEGSDDPAIIELDKRISSNSSDVAAHYKRGQLYAQHGSYRQAIQDFDVVIRANGKDAEALNNRCWTRAVLGELQLALTDCNAAIAARPRYADAYDSRGLAHLKAGNTKEAIADYDESLRVNPKQASSLYGRGLAKSRSGNSSAGNADILAAKGIQSDIVEEFARYGVQ